MKQTSKNSPSIIRPGQIRKQNSNFQSGGVINQSNQKKKKKKSLPSFHLFKAAAQKVAGVFSFFLLWRSQAKPKTQKPDIKEKHNQLNQTSISKDNSTGRSQNCPSKFKHSNSYGSSKATSGEVEAGIHGSVLEIAEHQDIAIDVAHSITYRHMYTGNEETERRRSSCDNGSWTGKVSSINPGGGEGAKSCSTMLCTF